MRYMDSLKFVMVKNDWIMQVLMCAICIIIPAVGPIVLIGYMFEVFDALRRDPATRDYPSFDWNRFVPYLTRGIWVFLVQFVAQMILMVPLFILMFSLSLCAGLASKGGGGAIIALTYFVMILLGVVLGLVLSVIIWPMQIYEGIRQTLDVNGLIRFTKDFARRMWKEILLATLFMMVCGIVLSPLVIITCGLGAYLVAAFLSFAHYHLLYQTYAIYLERGGTPVPEKSPREYPAGEVLDESRPPAPREPRSGGSDNITAAPPPPPPAS